MGLSVTGFIARRDHVGWQLPNGGRMDASYERFLQEREATSKRPTGKWPSRLRRGRTGWPFRFSTSISSPVKILRHGSGASGDQRIWVASPPLSFPSHAKPPGHNDEGPVALLRPQKPEDILCSTTRGGHRLELAI